MDPVEDFYRNYYSLVFSTKGLSSYFSALTHKALEREFDKARGGSAILEIGAGKGEHFQFVNQNFGSYTMLDLFPQPTDFSEFQGADWVQADLCDKSLELPQSDRILSMCVFHHIEDPKTAIQNIKRFLKPGGTFSLFLPSDPGMLNRLNRKLFVTPAAKNNGFNEYELVNAREHRNHYWGLKTELEHQFKDYRISRKYYPFGIPAGNLSLFSIWQIKSDLPYSLCDVV